MIDEKMDAYGKEPLVLLSYRACFLPLLFAYHIFRSALIPSTALARVLVLLLAAVCFFLFPRADKWAFGCNLAFAGGYAIHVLCRLSLGIASGSQAALYFSNPMDDKTGLNRLLWDALHLLEIGAMAVAAAYFLLILFSLLRHRRLFLLSLSQLEAIQHPS